MKVHKRSVFKVFILVSQEVMQGVGGDHMSVCDPIESGSTKIEYRLGHLAYPDYSPLQRQHYSAAFRILDNSRITSNFLRSNVMDVSEPFNTLDQNSGYTRVRTCGLGLPPPSFSSSSRKTL